MMTSPIYSGSKSFDSSHRERSKSRFEALYNRGGVLLLEEAERAPEFLSITIDSNGEESRQENNKDESEDEVVILGEKIPTYQEITLEEDETGEIKENVVVKEKSPVEKQDTKPPSSVFPSYQCSFCGRYFILEYLLNRHVRMHNTNNNNEIKENVVEKDKSSEKKQDTNPPSPIYPTYKCSFCGQCFFFEYLLNLHVTMHKANNNTITDSSSQSDDHKLHKHKKKRSREQERKSKRSQSTSKHNSHKEKLKSHKKKKKDKKYK